jgi:hypothetical protein
VAGIMRELPLDFRLAREGTFAWNVCGEDIA